MDITDCISTEEIREVTLEDEHLSALAGLVLSSWLSTKYGEQKEPQTYWSFRDVMAAISCHQRKKKKNLTYITTR